MGKKMRLTDRDNDNDMCNKTRAETQTLKVRIRVALVSILYSVSQKSGVIEKLINMYSSQILSQRTSRSVRLTAQTWTWKELIIYSRLKQLISQLY